MTPMAWTPFSSVFVEYRFHLPVLFGIYRLLEEHLEKRGIGKEGVGEWIWERLEKVRNMMKEMVNEEIQKAVHYVFEWISVSE
jgi:hypothetical protein